MFGGGPRRLGIWTIGRNKKKAVKKTVLLLIACVQRGSSISRVRDEHLWHPSQNTVIREGALKALDSFLGGLE